jgi:hypothetical protein
MRITLSVFLLSICLAAMPAAAGVSFWSPIGPEGGPDPGGRPVE